MMPHEHALTVPFCHKCSQVQRRAPDETFVAATLDHASALSPYHVGLESGDQRCDHCICGCIIVMGPCAAI